MPTRHAFNASLVFFTASPYLEVSGAISYRETIRSWLENPIATHIPTSDAWEFCVVTRDRPLHPAPVAEHIKPVLRAQFIPYGPVFACLPHDAVVSGYAGVGKDSESSICAG